MVRVSVACLLAATGVAAAGPTHRVTVETTPPGASVYLNDKDSDPVCSPPKNPTPCTFDAPIGETPVIVELEKYDAVIDMISVPKRVSDGKPLKFTFKLAHAVGTLSIQTASAKGAAVTIDDLDQGKVPVSVELEAGSHHVVVTAKDGQKLLEKDVKLEAGEERDLPVKVAAKDPPQDRPSDPPTTDGDHPEKPSIVATAPEPHDRYFVVGAAFDFIAREFRYGGGQKGASGIDLTNYSQQESGPLVGGTFELWPMELVHAGFARPLSLFVKVAFGVTHQEVLTVDPSGVVMPLGAKTLWGNIDASIRYRWVIADTIALQPDIGMVRDQLQYDATPTAKESVPFADYWSIKVGARASLLLGSVEPYVHAEGRIVESSGELASRFDSTTTDGVHIAAGLNTRLGPLSARLEAAYTRYRWTFTHDVERDYVADTATDRLLTFTALVGYTY